MDTEFPPPINSKTIYQAPQIMAPQPIMHHPPPSQFPSNPLSPPTLVIGS